MTYDFYYQPTGSNWLLLASDIDVRHVSSSVGGFTGTTIGFMLSTNRSARSLLFESFENLVHHFSAEGREVLQFQRLHHMECALLVLLEVSGLDVVLIGFLRGVDFEDVDLSLRRLVLTIVFL